MRVPPAAAWKEAQGLEENDKIFDMHGNTLVLGPKRIVPGRVKVFNIQVETDDDNGDEGDKSLRANAKPRETWVSKGSLMLLRQRRRVPEV